MSDSSFSSSRTAFLAIRYIGWIQSFSMKTEPEAIANIALADAVAAEKAVDRIIAMGVNEVR